MLKNPFKTIALLILLFIIALSFLLSDYNPIFKNDEFVFLSKELKASQKQDLKSIIDIHNKIYKNIKEENCPCEVAANYIGPYRHGYSLTKLLNIAKTKLDFTQNECLEFVLLNNSFGHDNKGIKAAAQFYFKKNIEQLNEREIITLLTVFKNPGLYDPIRNKEVVDRRVATFQKILHNRDK